MKFYYNLFLIFVFNTCLVKNANANRQCISTFNILSDNTSDQTSAFLAYLGNIIEEDILSLDNLKQFKLNLENGFFENPIHTSTAEVNPSYEIHYQHLTEFFYENALDQNRIVKWLENFIRDNQVNKNHTDHLIVETKSRLYLPIVFHPVKLSKGNYIELMAAPVTQYQWAIIMGVNPSHFFNGVSSEIIEVHGNKIQLQPNHPVELITPFSAMVFANTLSQKQGMKPFYRFEKFLSNRSFEEAAHGTFLLQGTIDEKREAIPGSIHGGYRLPDKKEQDLILKKIFVCDRKKILHNAWLSENARSQTQEVGTLDPLFVHGHPFYDIYGNVLEWHTCTALFSGDSLGLSGKGCYLNSNNFKNSVVSGSCQYPNIGFRLIRNITENEYKERLK